MFKFEIRSFCTEKNTVVLMLLLCCGRKIWFTHCFLLCNPMEMTWSNATEMELQKRPLTSSCCLVSHNIDARVIWLFGCVLWVLLRAHALSLIFTYHSKLYLHIVFLVFFQAQSYCHIYFCWNLLSAHFSSSKLIFLLFLLLVFFFFCFRILIWKCNLPLILLRKRILLLFYNNDD